MRLRPHVETCWSNLDFLKLWTGETISLFGSQITILALPLIAALMLRATSIQMGILEASANLPFLLLTLPAGVWVDRLQRRPLLIIGNVGRAVLLGLIPLCAWLDVLRLEYFYLIAFFVGVLTVFFQLAYQSYLPTLIHHTQLVEGNQKLQISESLARIAGPGLGGILVQALSAPGAMLLDVSSFLFSAILVFCIHTHEQLDQRLTPRSLRQEMKEGMSATFRHPYLRILVVEAATYNLFWNCSSAVYVLFVLRDLHISPEGFGFILALGSTGALLGALLAAPLGHRWGIGPTLAAAMLLAGFTPLLIPLAHGPLMGTCLLAAIALFMSAGITITNVHVVSLRQAVTPNRLLGRVHASFRFVTWGVIPLGNVLGGFLGGVIGIRATLFVGALGAAIAGLWVTFSPVARLDHIPQLEREEIVI